MIVAGAAGFLGSHLCEAHLLQGEEVLGIDNFATGMRETITYLQSKYPRFSFLEKDVSEPWGDLPNHSRVYHFASPASPPHYQRLAVETLWANALGLKSAIHYADKHQARVIFASTSEIYGDPTVSPQPESYWGNVNSYGMRACYDEAKRFCEALLFASNKANNTQHGLVRIFNTYGPRMNPNDGRVIIQFLMQGIENKPLTIYGDGSQTRSFCYVDDLVQGILLYAASDETEPMNLGNDQEFRIDTLATIVQQELFPEKKLTIHYSPWPADDPRRRCPDLTRAKRILGWQPTISLREGLEAMKRCLE